MSRQNKAAKRKIVAKQFTATRKSGGKGPSSTTSSHGKKNAWWQRGSYTQFAKGGKRDRPDAS
jgi:hypothetical protein